MNNRYLYKAKRIDNGEWVEGDLVHSVYKINDTCVGKYGSDVGIHQVCENTICQCTGLKDKNGKLIWENDVVKCQDTIGIVNWNKTHLAYTILKKNKDGNMQYYYMDEELGKDIEVIGNTFDNPELLEVEE